jgi:hypothetical protein
MTVPSYAGYWTGTFEGTNQGGLTVDIRDNDGTLSGVARFSEPALGQYERGGPIRLDSSRGLAKWILCS